MEQLRRHVPQPTPYETEPLPLRREDPEKAAESREPLREQLVHVIHGPLSVEVPLSRMTIAEAYELLQPTLHLPPGAVALVDGCEVDPTTVLRPGSVLEFVRRAGVKGCER